MGTTCPRLGRFAVHNWGGLKSAIVELPLSPDSQPPERAQAEGLLLIRKANVPWLGCGVADFRLAEQGLYGLGLVLTTA